MADAPAPPAVAAHPDEARPSGEERFRVGSQLQWMYRRDLHRHDAFNESREQRCDQLFEHFEGKIAAEHAAELAASEGAEVTQERLQQLEGLSRDRVGARVLAVMRREQQQHRLAEHQAAVEDGRSVVDRALEDALADLVAGIESAAGHNAGAEHGPIVTEMERRVALVEGKLGAQKAALGLSHDEAYTGGPPTGRQILDGFSRDGTPVRMIVGEALFKTWMEQRQDPPARVPTRRRTDYGLTEHKFSAALGATPHEPYNLPTTRVTIEEAIEASSKLCSDAEETDFEPANDLLRAAVTVACQRNDYTKGLLEELRRSERDLSHIQPILGQAEGEFIVCAVRPKGGPGCGPKYSPFWMGGNSVGGANSNYESTYHLDGSTPESSPSLAAMEGDNSGFTRVYFLMAGLTICEAARNRQFMDDSCGSCMVVGFGLSGPGLQDVRPIYLFGESRGGRLVPWKRFGLLRERKKPQFDCLVVILLVITVGVSARGWWRMRVGSALGFYVTQGAGFCFGTPSRERRSEVLAEEEEEIMHTAAGILVVAASDVNVDLAWRAIACAEVAALASELGGVGCASADTTCGILSAAADEEQGGPAAEEQGNAAVRLEATELFYRASGVVWRCQRAVMGARDILQAVTAAYTDGAPQG